MWGYAIGADPSVRNAFINAANQQEGSLIPGQQMKSKGSPLKVVKQPDSGGHQDRYRAGPEVAVGDPGGSGDSTVIPIGRTTTPYTLNTALQDLGGNVSASTNRSSSRRCRRSPTRCAMPHRSCAVPWTGWRI